MLKFNQLRGDNMAYFDKFDKKTWKELGESYEMMNPTPLTQQDITRSLIIAEDIISKYKTIYY